MITTQPERYQGFTFWLHGTEGNYSVSIEGAPAKIATSDRTFATAREAIAYAKQQIDLVNCLKSSLQESN
jgi:hypothetical protein